MKPQHKEAQVTETAVKPCESCGRTDGKHTVVGDRPDLDTLEEWMNEGGCEATDGCWVESDGRCEHGHQSWLLKMGMI